MQQIAARRTAPKHGIDILFPAIFGQWDGFTLPRLSCGPMQALACNREIGNVWAARSSFPCMNLPHSCKDRKIHSSQEESVHRACDPNKTGPQKRSWNSSLLASSGFRPLTLHGLCCSWGIESGQGKKHPSGLGRSPNSRPEAAWKNRLVNCKFGQVLLHDWW